MVLFLVTLWSSIAALSWLILDQARRGRFTRLDPAPLDLALAQSDLLRMPAEVAGTAIDDSVDLDDVKAMITRMVLEKKLAACVKSSELELKLLVPFAELKRPAEWQLAYSLFVRGETIDRSSLISYWQEHDRIDPKAPVTGELLAKVLAGKGFNAAEKVEAPLLDEARAVTGARTKRVPDIAVWFYVVLIFFGSREPAPLSVRSLALLLLTLVMHLISMRLAERMRRKDLIGAADIATVLLPLMIAAGTAAWFTKLTLLFSLVFVGSIVNVVLRARSAGERSKLRRAVDFIENALSSTVPIHVDLVPYALAFGLGPRIKKVRDEDSIDAFRECGGVARFNELLDRFLTPFRTVSSD